MDGLKIMGYIYDVFYGMDMDPESSERVAKILSKYFPYDPHDFGIENLNKIIKELFILERETYDDSQKKIYKEFIDILQRID